MWFDFLPSSPPKDCGEPYVGSMDRVAPKHPKLEIDDASTTIMDQAEACHFPVSNFGLHSSILMQDYSAANGSAPFQYCQVIVSTYKGARIPTEAMTCISDRLLSTNTSPWHILDQSSIEFFQTIYDAGSVKGAPESG